DKRSELGKLPRLGKLLKGAVEIADVDLALDHLFAVKAHRKAQDPVGAGVLRPHAELEKFGSIFELAHRFGRSVNCLSDLLGQAVRPGLIVPGSMETMMGERTFASTGHHDRPSYRLLAASFASVSRETPRLGLRSTKSLRRGCAS